MSDLKQIMAKQKAEAGVRRQRLQPHSAYPVSEEDIHNSVEFYLGAQGICDYVVPAFGITNNGETDLIVATENGAIYVTKEQAMAFFNLIEKGEHYDY